ncbi:bifunctional alpha/beta hydrolase/OsmC family protein [Roseivivax isoporae]|uniref:Osmotically inducible protein C n=1 Tax=Roseivivax isoporae LMG 25204 TaxID=1449351 RepID=X7F2L7_9RHOB|nr:bifunctional alpha/beta hydrolase/OsmC family protein [Roseivivax isoporae]ETX27152.1 osmotically inducible protein C [Roseivivax isoporae LMG 25204]
MAPERLSFTGATGATLAARLDRPDGPHLATALFAHCFTCGKDIAAARRIASRLTAAGVAVLRFDFTGLGHSGGEFENTSFTSNVGDIVAAARALEARGMAPDLLIGHSLGGAAVLRAAADIPSARAVATIGAPHDPGHVTRHFADALERIESDGAAEVSLSGRPFRIGRDFVHDVRAQRLDPAIAALGRALLILHAPRDAVVGIDNASAIFAAAKHPKSFVTLDGADHLVSDPADADYVAGIIAAWAARYVDLVPREEGGGAPEGVVRVSEADPGGFLTDIVAGRHHLQADEPPEVGGTDRGMSPYNLLCAALGACTSMTLRMYARRKGLALDHVRVDVSHDRRHATDAETETPAKVDAFVRDITLEGDLSDADRARLLEIADRCPVHRTLEQGARVETRAVR